MTEHKTQFTIRSALACTACLATYLALARTFGYGRGLVCVATILQGGSSILFFFAAYHSANEENPRNASAAILLGCMILTGSFFVGFAVFQVPESESQAFELEQPDFNQAFQADGDER